jgi:hypothetical protein
LRRRDSRISNWTSIDPLFEKHIDYSPYNYVLREPIRLVDPEGKQVQVIGGMALEALTEAAAYAAAYGIIIYAGYKIYENLSEYQRTEPILSQESVEVTQDANVANQIYESSRSNTTIKGHIEGAIKQIIKHVDRQMGRDPNYPNPEKNKKNDFRDLKKHWENIKKWAKQLKKDPQQVIDEVVNATKSKNLTPYKVKQTLEEIQQLKVPGLK